MDATLLSRLHRYQAERFPLAAYVPLVAVATFAAVAFSRAARATAGWVGPGPAVTPAATPGATPASTAPFPWSAWAVGAVTVLAFFFFLRVLDEHKDAPDDARYRPELPVPRGLVTLRELRGVALAAIALAVALNAAISPALLVPMAAVLAWAGFMGREFFVRDWLRAHPFWYLVSHMVVMPLIFLYATTPDWLAAGAPPPPGLPAFLALAFCNGLVIEIGRKLRAPPDEREGVDTYTGAWGLPVAAGAWVVAVVAATTFGLLVIARVAAEPGDAVVIGPFVLGVLALGALLPAARLLVRPEPGRGAGVERAAGVWVLGSYAVVAAMAYLGAVA